MEYKIKELLNKYLFKGMRSMGEFAATKVVDKRGREVVIRAARSEDAEKVLTYNRNIMKTETYMLTTAEEFNLTAEDERLWIEKVQKVPDNLVILAEHLGEVVGFSDFQCGLRKRNAHTGSFSISVRSDFRGCGVGKALIQALLNWADGRQQIEKIGLSVFASNKPAIGLYRRMGFIEESLLKKQIKLENGDYVDLIGMGLLIK